MSLRETLEKNANAALALIVIVGYGVQALAATWPDTSPTPEWIVLELGLAVVAFAFYREDKNYKKDPGIREATVKVAADDLLNDIAKVIAERAIDLYIKQPGSESEVKTDEQEENNKEEDGSETKETW